MNIPRITRAHQRLGSINNVLRDAILKELPKHAAVSWVRNAGRTYHGTIIDHGFGHRLYVHNTDTGRNLWISISDVLRVPQPRGRHA